jgi:hypothetical protein
MAPATGATAYLVNHVVLPPDLPQVNDYDVAYEKIVLEVTTLALQDLQGHIVEGGDEPIKAAIAALKCFSQIRDSHGYVKEDTLLRKLRTLLIGDANGMIPVEIKSQNAGLLIRRDHANIVFESFELSPTNEAAMKCEGRLQRTFPGLASKISISKMQEASLTQSLASTLANMTAITAADFQPQERADTIHPGLVTDYLMNVIAAVGEPVDVARIVKHTREEVLSRQAGMPWRRSPLWLFIRVTLQLIMRQHGDSPPNSDELYKAFVILVLSRVLTLAKEDWQLLGSDSIKTISAKLIRRIHKVDDVDKSVVLKPGWQAEVRENLIDAHSLLDTNWKEATESTDADIDSDKLLNVHPEQDLDIGFPKLDAFLSQTAVLSPSTTTHDFRPTYGFPVYPPDQLPNGLSHDDDNRIHRLAATEFWVERCLQPWVDHHKTNPSSCGELQRLMEAYHVSATTIYSKSPESLSIMYLTLCEIWVQCDTIVCLECPLLKKYDPDVQLQELQCLSLPLKSQLERLHNVEVYVQTRKSAAVKDNPSVYCEFGNASSFAVKYVQSEQGAGLCTLLAEVQRIAAENYQAKCKELEILKHQHWDLVERYNTSECEYDVTMADDEDEGMYSSDLSCDTTGT